MARPEKEAAEALAAIKASKAEVSRNKVSSAQLLRSSQKINKNIEGLYEAGKDKVKVAIDQLKTTFTTRSTKLKTEMDEERSAVEQIRKETKKEYRRFKSAYQAATRPQEGVAARHAKIVDLHSNASRLHGEISKNATSARNAETKIQDLHKNAKKHEGEIAEVNERTNTLGKEIEDTYSIVLDTTLAGTLVTRRDDLKPRVRNWELTYIGSLVLISLAIILALTVARPTTLLAIVTERLVFITPLVVVAFVASRQFSHERKLLEEYAFKAATAQSLKGYTLLLNEQFKDMPDSRKAILDFTIGAMKNIYDRQPLEGKNSKYHFVAGNKLARIEAKIEEIQQEVREKKIIQKATIE